MENKKIRVAITHGDTNGVGYEIILKAFEDPTMLELCTPIIYGSPKVATYHCNVMGIQTQFSILSRVEGVKDDRVNLLAVIDDEVKVDMGHPTPESAEAARKVVQQALSDYEAGLFDVLVCGPEESAETGREGLTLLMAENLNVAFVTNKLAIKDVAEAITKPIIVEKAKTLHQALKRDLRISNPRIAVLALNPKGGVHEEEDETIVPAINELAQQGIQAFGPYQADEFFGTGAYMRFDAVLAMYYDQGMAPFKAIAADEGIKYTAGLPLVKTATMHDAQYSIAGKGIADPTQMRHAIWQAIDIWRNRMNYDEPLAHPLPKLYHEKRDDSEKVRFSVPKGREQQKKENKQPSEES